MNSAPDNSRTCTSTLSVSGKFVADSTVTTPCSCLSISLASLSRGKLRIDGPDGRETRDGHAQQRQHNLTT